MRRSVVPEESRSRERRRLRVATERLGQEQRPRGGHVAAQRGVDRIGLGEIFRFEGLQEGRRIGPRARRDLLERVRVLADQLGDERVHVVLRGPGQPRLGVRVDVELEEARAERRVQGVHLILAVLGVDRRDAHPAGWQRVRVQPASG